MKICVTFPGRNGDLLWALPTVRAISRRIDAPVHLRVGAALGSIVPLLQQQPYLASCKALIDWATVDTAPISPRTPAAGWLEEPYDEVVHLGYREWPDPDLLRHTLETVNRLPLRSHVFTQRSRISEAELALGQPWITVPVADTQRVGVTVGFTDEHFELKYGVTELLRKRLGWRLLGVGRNTRWIGEAGWAGLSWVESAQYITTSQVFLGCNSALHVLAVATGTPVVMLEPNPHRHGDVFFPLGKVGRVALVCGTDGQPTWDSRHTADRVVEVLRASVSR